MGLTKKRNIILSLVIFSILVMGLIGAISFTQIFPTTSPYVTNASTVNISYSISAPDGLLNTTFSWNGTNTTLIDSSLVGWCNFENNTALNENFTHINCWSSSGGFNGTKVGNPVWSSTTGKYGGAYWFDGTGDAFKVTATPWNVSTGSACFWAKTGSFDETDYRFAIGNYINNFIYFSYQSPNVYLRITDQATTVQCGLNKAGLSINTWYHFCGTWNFGQVGNCSLYVNGSLASQDLTVNTTLVNMTDINGSEIMIGASKPDGSNSFNGSLDDVMVFNRSLSANEVSQIYNTQITKYNSTYCLYNTTQNVFSYSQPYFLCSSNSTGYQTCSAEQTVRQVNTVTANFSNSIGTIRSDFYGIGVSTGYFNEWDKAMFLASGMNYLRIDMRLNTYSTSEGVYNPTELAVKQNITTWAKANNVKIMWIAHGMPPWLADTTQNWCYQNASDTDGNKTCPPSNHTKWGETIVDFLTDVGCDATTCEVELWNEPNTLPFWMNNLSNTNPNRSVEYNKLYNATYLAVKSAFPTMQVGGVGTTGTNLPTQLIMLNWMGNFSNQIDSVSHHDYLGQSGFTDFHSGLASDYSWIYGNMTAKGVNTSRVIIGEFNVADDDVRANHTDEWAMQLGLAYEVTLNSYPDNVSLLQYQFVDDTNNSFQMIDADDNSFLVSYNLTNNFAHVLPSGCDMKVSSSDNSNVKIATCKTGSFYGMAIINSGTDAVNETLNFSQINGTCGYPYNNLTNYTGGNLITVTNCQASIEIINSHDVVFLNASYGGDAIYPSINITYPINTTYPYRINYTNYTVNELNPSYCWLSNGTTNSSLVSSGTNFTTQSIEGLNTWIIFCNDTANNVNSSRISFTQDTSSPIITITNPAGADETSNPINLIVSANELSTCDYSLNSGVNTSLGSGTSFSTLMNLVNGIHTFRVFCNDTFGNNNVTGAFVSFNVYVTEGAVDTGGTSGGTTPIEIIDLDHINIDWNFKINEISFIYISPLTENDAITNVTNVTINVSEAEYQAGALERLEDGRYRQAFNSSTGFKASITVMQNSKEVKRDVFIDVERSVLSTKISEVKSWLKEHDWAWIVIGMAFMIILISYLSKKKYIHV